MNELIKTTQTVIGAELVNAVNARGLHEFLGAKKDFSNWMKDRIGKYGFEEGKDFSPILAKTSNGRPMKEYYITIDMAKELAMVENNEQGRRARQYFIEVEKRFKSSTVTAEAIVAAMTPLIREAEQLRAKYDVARNFLPHGKPGDLNENGDAKNNFRRGYYTAGKGRSATLLLEHPTLPGMFEEYKCADFQMLRG